MDKSPMNDAQWVKVCGENEIENESVHRFDYEHNSYALYNLDGEFYATDGYCTHEQQHLEDGFVVDGIIECPLHMGQFDIETGEALAGPVCIDLKTYDVKNEAGTIYINI
jgi:3-phenylpropionate/trans-cinnamate dioxygenase ferredoxin subunit